MLGCGKTDIPSISSAWYPPVHHPVNGHAYSEASSGSTEHTVDEDHSS